MVGRLGWLKARLTWNSLRADVQRRIGLPLTVILMGWGGWTVANKLLDGIDEVGASAAGEFTAWAAFLMLMAWVALPIVLFPLDENLDPAQFALLPLTKPQLAAGLTLAGFISPAMVIPVLILGAGISAWWAKAGFFTFVTAALLLVTMIVGSQLFTSVLSAILKTRRGRDLSVLIVAGLGMTAYGSQQVITGAIDRLGLRQAVLSTPLLEPLWMLPGVSAVKVTTAAAQGSLIGAVVATVVSVAWIWILAAGWQRQLDWMLTTPDSSPAPSRTRGRRGLAGSLVPGRSVRGWGPITVIARKELRFYVRDPRQRLVWTGAAIFIGIAVASILVGTGNIARFQAQPWLPLLAPILVLFVGLPIALNQFGWERNAASFLFVFPTSARRLLLGKNLAAGLALGVETIVLSSLLALLTDSPTDLVLIPALAFCAIACQLAVGNVVSVLAPLRLPREGTDVFSQATEQGCLAIGAQLVSFAMIGMLLVIPASATVLTVAFNRPIAVWVTVLICIGWGLAVYGVALWIAGGILKRRIPEVAGLVQVR